MAHKMNRIWRDLGLPMSARVSFLPPGSGACRTPPLTGTDAEIADQLIAQTTGFEPRRSEA